MISSSQYTTASILASSGMLFFVPIIKAPELPYIIVSKIFVNLKSNVN